MVLLSLAGRCRDQRSFHHSPLCSESQCFLLSLRGSDHLLNGECDHGNGKQDDPRKRYDPRRVGEEVPMALRQERHAETVDVSLDICHWLFFGRCPEATVPRGGGHARGPGVEEPPLAAGG